jgi:hypothetical protein
VDAEVGCEPPQDVRGDLALESLELQRPPRVLVRRPGLQTLQDAGGARKNKEQLPQEVALLRSVWGLWVSRGVCGACG